MTGFTTSFALLPLAVAVGYWVYKRHGNLLVPSLIALSVMYLAIYVGVYYRPINLAVQNPIMTWTVILLVYCFFASVLPVWTLLQPRDYINSHQLILALGLLVIGLLVAGWTGEADLTRSAPAVVESSTIVNAPPIWPFLFITIVSEKKRISRNNTFARGAINRSAPWS